MDSSLKPDSLFSDTLPSSFNTPYRHAYGPKLRQLLHFTRPDRAKQSFKDECDINLIMKRYEQTGQIDHLANRPIVYGDVPALDFQQAMGLVVEAREQFGLLPAAVRDRFGNDPAQLMAFLENPANKEEGIRLGLLKAPTAPQAAPGAPAVPPATPTGGTGS